MKQVLISATALGLLSGAAMAGGLDRSGQGIGFIFEEGNYSELSYGKVNPSVKATPDTYGNIAGSYTMSSAAVKFDMGETLSFGIATDQPYGADVFYELLDSGAHVSSRSLKLLGRYKLGNGISVHGGVSNTTVSGWLNPDPTVGAPVGFRVNVAPSSDVGYILGVAYERPEIAARVALTYFSATEHNDASSNSFYNAPQAINLDLQTGIAANTLLFGSVRWADWSESVVNVGGTDIVTYAEDAVTYELGLGRKFSDAWSGAVTVGHEAAQGGTASALSPTDGSTSIGLGATYTRGTMKVTFGYSHIMLGDATTAGLPANDWQDNTAEAMGVKVAFTF